MKDCPIGLICEYFECDRRYCERLAKPWPLPYHIVPSSIWFPESHPRHLLVELPRIGYGVNAHSFIAIQTEIWNSGFFDPVKLPYRDHPEGGLLVVDCLELDEEVTFSCPCHYIFDEPLNYWFMDAPKYEEGEEFMPAVKIPGDKDKYSRGYFHDYSNTPLPELQSDEFWESDFLIYPHNEFLLDEYDEECEE